MRADHAFKALSDLFEQRVTSRVAHRIVHGFEPVEIKHEDRTGAIAGARSGEDLLQRLAHLHAVSEAGERIVMRQPCHLLFAATLLGQIRAVPTKAAEVLEAVIHRATGQRPIALLGPRISREHFDIAKG